MATCAADEVILWRRCLSRQQIAVSVKVAEKNPKKVFGRR
jgi:hypothetical protein